MNMSVSDTFIYPPPKGSSSLQGVVANDVFDLQWTSTENSVTPWLYCTGSKEGYDSGPADGNPTRNAQSLTFPLSLGNNSNLPLTCKFLLFKDSAASSYSDSLCNSTTFKVTADKSLDVVTLGASTTVTSTASPTSASYGTVTTLSSAQTSAVQPLPIPTSNASNVSINRLGLGLGLGLGLPLFLIAICVPLFFFIRRRRRRLENRKRENSDTEHFSKIELGADETRSLTPQSEPMGVRRTSMVLQEPTELDATEPSPPPMSEKARGKMRALSADMSDNAVARIPPVSFTKRAVETPLT